MVVKEKNITNSIRDSGQVILTIRMWGSRLKKLILKVTK